jgi:hypothetical protein
LLTACASQQTRIVQVRDLPPESLLIDTPIPVAGGRKNEDLARWAPELYCALVRSNEDKAALRAWRAGVDYKSSSTCE